MTSSEHSDGIAFRILFVEDDDQNYEFYSDLLKDLEMPGFSKVLIARACSAIEAKQAVSAGRGIQMVLLDLQYPESKGGTLIDDVFEGLNWLPELRKTLPQALIVVFSAFGAHHQFEVIRNALKTGADDFLPKGIPWGDAEIRLQKAWENSRKALDRRRLQAEAMQLMRSRAAQLHLSQVARAIGTHIHELELLATEISGGLTGGRAYADSFRGLGYQLREKLVDAQRHADFIHHGEPECYDVNQRLRDSLGWYLTQCEAHRVGLDWPDELRGTATTFFDDLALVLHELLQNAFCSTIAARSNGEGDGKVTVSISPSGLSGNGTRSFTISVEDAGIGFDQEDLDSGRVFAEDYTNWPPGAPDVPHGGVGLSIVRRVVENLAGQIEISNRRPHGASVVLTILDLSSGASGK